MRITPFPQQNALQTHRGDPRTFSILSSPLRDMVGGAVFMVL